MKITKYSKDCIDLEKRAFIANIGCEKCPECGRSNIKRIPVEKNWYNPLKGYVKAICYKCDMCGCEYESEPFNYV